MVLEQCCSLKRNAGRFPFTNTPYPHPWGPDGGILAANGWLNGNTSYRIWSALGLWSHYPAVNPRV